MKNKLSINELCYSTLSSDKPNSFDTYVSYGGTSDALVQSNFK